ncbi:Helicase domain-containing protein [Hibiscus syriacus]|uniref:Helicase domain-containing protein n=1 Tax=Hibiscus syriacus TaxID=106335 RepID=A0A6A2ZX12_HIBSY|nr:Helicase domain-containing protein [Hibiscus syriacus]
MKNLSSSSNHRHPPPSGAHKPYHHHNNRPRDPNNRRFVPGFQAVNSTHYRRRFPPATSTDLGAAGSNCPPTRWNSSKTSKPFSRAHVAGLMGGELVKKWQKKIDEKSDEITKLSAQMGKRNNSVRRFSELNDTKKALKAERSTIWKRLEEFKGGMGSLLRCLEDGVIIGNEDEDEDEGVEVFRVEGEIDWKRIHQLILWECRRLEDGLPIYAYRQKILARIHYEQVMVLIGETGSGKSTQLVQFLSDSGIAANESIVCTQPRKIAAISLAKRVREESIGCYNYNSVTCYPTFSSAQQFDSKVIYMTDHCLLQHYMNDRNLSGISCIIVDVAHERSLNTDLLLALLKDLLGRRVDLRLVIMSATANANQLSDYFFRCGILHLEGRNFPVHIKYVPHATEGTSGLGMVPTYVSDVLKMAAEVHKTEKEGNILSFLTSQMENDPGKRKIVFATNIAETSLTIPGIKYVIDSGMVKESKFEPGTGMNVLKVCWISQSSANQRDGRAGRTEPGSCYRLYTASDFELWQMPVVYFAGWTVMMIKRKLIVLRKNKWCWENSINAKSMRRCQDTVFELETCLKKEFAVIIPSYLIWDPHKSTEHDKILKAIILSSLAENVAMYSGHDKLGYEVALTRQHVGVEVNVDQNEILLFASSVDMQKVLDFVTEAVECEKKWLLNECMEKPLFHGRRASPSMALFGAGAEIKHLELDKRYLFVDVFHSNVCTFYDKELLTFFEDYSNGSICSVHKSQASGKETDEKEKWGKITFLTPDTARKAAKLDGFNFAGSALKVLPSQTSFGGDHKMFSFPAVKAKVHWPRRVSKGFGIIKCDLVDVGSILDDFSSLIIADKYVRCEVSRKCNDSIMIYGIGDAVENPTCDACEEALLREISPFMPKGNPHTNCCQVQVLKPEPRETFMKALITFDGRLHLEAAKALEQLEGKVLPGCLSWQKIRCQQLFHSSISCSSSVYAVIKKQLNSLLESFRHVKGCFLEENENGSCRVRISANATKTVAELRRPVEELMNGSTVKHASLTPSILQHLFARDGNERREPTYFLTGIVSIKQLEVRLRSRGLPPDMTKEMVKKFGPDLHGLKEKIPGAEFTLNTWHHIILIRGDKEMKQKVEEIVLEIAKAGRDFAERSDSEVTCSICLCEVEDGYRLEGSSHLFCRLCLLEQCESAIRYSGSFPVCCASQYCKAPILLTDLKSLLSTEKLEELFRASLGAFVASSGGAFRFCPSPDCLSVYRVADPDTSGEPFVCGACYAETCTRCHLEYHPYLSCEKYREFKEDPDSSLKEWCKGKDQETARLLKMCCRPEGICSSRTYSVESSHNGAAFFMELVFNKWLFAFSIFCWLIFSVAFSVEGLDEDSKVRGVNLGGWLVLEGWIKPSLFEDIPNADMLDGTQVSFKSVKLQKYVCAENGGGMDISVYRDSASSWETFTLWRVTESEFQFRTTQGQFLTCYSNGCTVSATAKSASLAETFQIERNNNGRVHIKTKGGAYLQATIDNQLTADYPGNPGWDDNAAVFEMSIAANNLHGDYQLANGYGYSKAKEVLETHRRTFINAGDFEFLQKTGINTVRIPVGWTYKINCIIDLHAAPGSQNGMEHSASRDGTTGWTTLESVSQTLHVINFLASRYANHPALLGIELLNEPSAASVPLDILVAYYKQGYDIVRKHSPSAYVIVCQRIGNADPIELYKADIGSHNVVVDLHYYNLFDPYFVTLSPIDNIQFVYKNREPQVQALNAADGPLVFIGNSINLDHVL